MQPRRRSGARFRGVPAYCQPLSDTADGFYQCDELANRFMRDALQHPDLNNVVTDYASTICERASTMSASTFWGPEYGATTGRTPVGGDRRCPGTPGHTAVIVGFTSATELIILQENGGPSTTSVLWDPDSSFIVDAECWVHTESAPPAELPEGSMCGCFAGGDACGLAIVNHEWWNGCVAGAPEGGIEYELALPLRRRLLHEDRGLPRPVHHGGLVRRHGVLRALISHSLERVA